MSLDGLDRLTPDHCQTRPSGIPVQPGTSGSTPNPITTTRLVDLREALDTEYRRMDQWRSSLSREEFRYRTLPWFRRLFVRAPTDSGGAR